MRPTQLVNSTSVNNQNHNNSQSTSPSTLFKSNNQFNHNQPLGSPSLSPEINMMLNIQKNDDKSIDMVKIDEIHRAVTLGNLRNVQQLIDRKRLAFCRDQMGATPLHKAVIYGQKEIIEYFLERFPSTIHTRDNRGRTPLHYAAVLPESADLYRMLSEAGADEKSLDMFGKKPEDYLNHQDGVSVVVLRESAIVSRPLGQRRSRKSASRNIDPQSWSKIHSSRSLMHRSNIRELIKQGNIITLEEIVIQGYGDRLIGETSSAPLVQEFLKNVPSLIDQINELHKSAQRGNVNDLKSLLDRKGIVFARDQIGCTPLHKAVLYGQFEVASFLSSEYPSTLDARDHDGRTALHYAAGLDDDRLIYNVLVKNGASANLPDYKGRSAEYYLRFPDQINLQQLMKRSQRLNANYAINTANRIKSKSPCRRRGLSPDSRKPEIHLSGYKSDTGLSDHETGDADGGSSTGSVGDVSHSLLTKANLRSKPGSSLNFSSPAILREVTSANLRKWIQEADLSSLEGAILEGHGDRVKSKVEMSDQAKESPDIQNYIQETLPKVMNKIRKIHAAVSCGDLIGLQDHLDKNDYALAKDHLGMAPLHKAVILGHIDVVQFILDRFPETVNARDREGRTPLHYAAATTHKNGQKIYKVLLRSGADQRARDSVGKTAEYYRVHLLPLPAELSRLAVNSKRKNGDGHHQVLSPLHKRRGILLPSIREKISNALHEGDAGTLLELTLDGYGDALLGRASWGDESRKFLKGLPHLLDNIRTLHASISNGELSNVQRILETDPNLIRAKDENGLMAIHLAVSRDQPEIVDYLLEEFTSSCLLLKDQFGRTGLHIAAQNKQQEIYKKLLDAGGDPMIIDLRGRTADHYLKLQTTGDAYHNKLFPSSAVNNSDINNSPSKRNLSNNHNPSPVVEVKNNISDDPSVKKEISTNEIDLENGKSISELLEIKENDTIDQQSTNDEPKPEQDETNNQKDDNENESGDQNELDDKTDEDKEVNLDETVTINTNQPIEPEIQSTVKVDQDSPGESGQETADENIGHSGDDQVIVSDEVIKESPVDQSELVGESTEAQVTTNDGDDRETDKSNETHKSETTVEETKFGDDEGSGIKIDDESKEKDDDLKDQLVESENIDEEKIENNRQDAVIEEKILPKGKKISSNTKGGIKKFTSLKKTPPSSTESEKVVEDKKMKVNRKTSLPSVVGARSSSKDRLEKKKVSLNNRNGPTLGTKGIAKNVRIKEDSVNKLNEEKTENNPTIDGKSSDGTDDKIIENEVKEKDEDEEVGKMEEKLEENSENNEKEESNQPELENQNSESNLGENIPNGEDTNQGTGGDGESTDLIPIIKVEAEIVSEDETEQLASSHVDSDVERQAKEIVQGLVESSIQQAESKLSLNIGDGDVTSIQEASELIDDKVDERIKTGGTDSEASVEAAINQIEKDEEDEEIGNANGGEKSSSQPKGSKPQSAHEKEDEINLDEKSSDQSINQSNENEPSKSTAPESSEINDENNSEQSKLNENEKTESTSNEINSDDHEISLIVEDKDEIISQNQESSRKQRNQKDQQSNGNKVDDQETKLDEEHKINNENPAKSPKTSGLNGQQSGGDGGKSDQPPRSGSGKKKPKSGESSSSRLMSGSSPISNNSNDNVDMLNDLIETWLKDGDLLRLEHVVIAGQGERLIGKKSSKETVQEFLDLVPAYMAKIRNVHETVVRGNFNEVRSILTRKRFALSRDHVGSSPLHLAVLHGHMDVLVYIITQFPETLDGPDNEGRTPLHYAAVMASKDKQYYDILKKAGANPSLIDKLGHTADFYLENPHELTIGDLLSNYALKTESSSNHKEPGSVDVWQRPPTADIESRLTPSPSDSQLEEDEGPTHHEIAADVHVDANEKVPSTPTNGSGAKGKLSTSPGVAEEDVKKEVETISVQFKETLKEEKNKLQESIRQIMGSVPGQPPESLSSGEESSDERKREEVVSEYELCQVKDEHGRTVLHLVSSKPQKKVILYQMLASAEYLIPERDEKYRTIRDVAVNSALKDNVQVIDNYILDAFVRRNVGFVQRLSHEGYDLTNVVDEEGHDVTAVLRKRKITSMINLLQDITYFQKSREELHTFIKNDYIQGVLGLVDSDATLVTAKNRRSRTALHIAILFGNLDIISSLIDANPEASNVQDNLGRTPLHYAMATSKVEHIGKMLIKAGANRQIRDVKMRTPSYYFVYNDDIRAIRSEEKNLL